MDSIRAHKLRSFLTLLGVIIGVASVILVGAAIDGLGVYAEQSTAKAFGSDSFMVAQIAAAGRLSAHASSSTSCKRQQTDPAPTTYRYLETVTGDNMLYSPYRQHTADVKRRKSRLRGHVHLGAVRLHGQKSATSWWWTGRFFTDAGGAERAPMWR